MRILETERLFLREMTPDDLDALCAVLQWALRHTAFPAYYSYCKSDNTASYKTAEAIGMRFDREYPDAVNGITHVSVIRRTDCERSDSWI